jgi:hypothetical protein
MRKKGDFVRRVHNPFGSSKYSVGLGLLSLLCDAGASSVVRFESLAFELLVEFRIQFRIKSHILLTSSVIRVLLLFYEMQSLQGKPKTIYQTNVIGTDVTDRTMYAYIVVLAMEDVGGGMWEGGLVETE